MTSQTALGFTPSTPNSYATPVTVENATGGLCGARLPNGKGILVWPSSGGAHYAVVNSTADFQVDNVVPAGSIGIAVANSAGVRRSSVFCFASGLYIITVEKVGNAGKVMCYKANDSNNPTSWSLHSTIDSVFSGTAYYFGEPYLAGIPLRLDSGRWVLPQPTWENTPEVQAQTIGLFTSDNEGASWTRRVSYQHQYILNYTSGQAAQTARDPNTGNLYFWSGSDAGGVTYGLALWKSTNAGSDWTIINPPSGAWFYEPHLTGIVDNGTLMYSASLGGGSTNIWSLAVDADNVNDWVNTGQAWHPPGGAIAGESFKAVVTPGEVYYFWYNRVARNVYSELSPTRPRYHVGY